MRLVIEDVRHRDGTREVYLSDGLSIHRCCPVCFEPLMGTFPEDPLYGRCIVRECPRFAQLPTGPVMAPAVC